MVGKYNIYHACEPNRQSSSIYRLAIPGGWRRSWGVWQDYEESPRHKEEEAHRTTFAKSTPGMGDG